MSDSFRKFAEKVFTDAKKVDQAKLSPSPKPAT